MIVPIVIPSKGRARVVAYTVHEPPNPPADRLDRAERLVFVKDGFNWTAAALAPVWMIANRLWLGLAAYAAVMAVLIAVLIVAPPEWIALAIAVVHIVVGFEADQMQRHRLETTGHTPLGTVIGRNESDCERRFIEKWLPAQPILARSAPVGGPTGTAHRGPGDSAAPTAATASAGPREARRSRNLTRRLLGRLAGAGAGH